MRCLALLLALFSTAALAQGQADILRAEQRGLALFQAYQRPAEALNVPAKVDRCEGPYRTVKVGETVYVLSEKPEGIAVGRHFRVEKDGAVSPSSRGCLVLQDAASASAGGTRPARASLIHTLSDTPSEFHVFLSLRHDMPIYVATRAGLWKVEAGLITRTN